MGKKLFLKEVIKLNNKNGFTLVEILVTIAIVAIVFGIFSFSFFNIVSSSKEKVTQVALNNVKEAASLYAKEENDSIDWFDNYDKNSDDVYEQYVCVTVKQLINKGFFKEGFFKDNIYKDSNIDDNTVIQIRRNYASKADFEIKVLPNTTMAECEILAADNSIIKSDGYVSYTDTVNLKIDTVDSSNYSCYISEKDGSKSNISAKLDSNSCVYEKLKNNKHYVSKICLSSGTRKSCQAFEVKTKDFQKINIFVADENVLKSSKGVTISYDDTNIINGNGKHYFIAEFNAILDGSYDIYKCVSDNGGNQYCINKISDNKIVANQLYLVKQSVVKFIVSEVIGDEGKKITATIADPTGNSSVASEVVKKIVGPFNLYYNSNGGSGCSSKTVAFGATYGTLCTPTRAGYSFDGWYTSSDGESKISSDSIYNVYANSTIYAHWKPYKVTINFKVDGGSVTYASKNNGFGVNSSGYVTKDGSIYTFSYSYGEAAKDLPNNTNSNFLELSKSNEGLLNQYAWMSNSGFCNGGRCIYSSDINYSATDFVYESDLQKGNMTVTLIANWKFKAVRMDDRWYIWKGPGYYTSARAAGRLCSVTSGSENCYNVGTSQNASINSMMYGTYRNVGNDKSFIVFGYVDGSYYAADDGNGNYKAVYAGATFLKIFAPYILAGSDANAGYIRSGGGGTFDSSSSKIWYYYANNKYTTYYAVWLKGSCSNASDPKCSSSGNAILGKY